MAIASRTILLRAASVVLGPLIALVVVEVGLRVVGRGSPVDGTDLIQAYEPTDVFEADANASIGFHVRPGYAGKQVYRSATTGEVLHEAVTTVSMGGFRDESRRTAGKVVLAVGDSTTFGVGVADGESWPAALEESLDASWRVMNAGTPGRNMGQEIAWIQGHAAEVQPAVILLAFYVNDLQPPIPVSGDVTGHRMDAPPWASREAGLRRASRLYNLGWRAWERRQVGAPGAATYEDQMVKGIYAGDIRQKLEQVQLASGRAGARAVLVLLPALDLSDPRIAEPLFMQASDAAAALNMAVVHAEGALETMDIPDRRVLPGEHHASPRANARIAEAIRSGLVDAGVL